MIIDCHAHVFRHWAGACGHESREIHWKHIQKNVTRPAAKVRRARDGAPGDPATLSRLGDNTWAGLRDDIQFRVGPFGRLEYTLDGEDYYIQYMPVGMAEMEAPPGASARTDVLRRGGPLRPADRHELWQDE